MCEHHAEDSSTGTRPSVSQRLPVVMWFASLVQRGAIGLVRIYQIVLSPWLGRNCRFVPSCSQYMIGVIEKYGVIRGVLRGVLRICRCHPFHRGGYDPP
ncbi:MAG: membrane protein insertion efficiency factor YidD [Planctomycetota bacterium]